jgi:hypothetical protein
MKLKGRSLIARFGAMIASLSDGYL